MNSLEVAVGEIENWCNDNCLDLNAEKMKFSIFSGIRTNLVVSDYITFDTSDINIYWL